jgi:hypothetical protein
MKALKTALIAIGIFLGVVALLVGVTLWQHNRRWRPYRTKRAQTNNILNIRAAFESYRKDHGEAPHSIAQVCATSYMARFGVRRSYGPYLDGVSPGQFAVVQGDPTLVYCTVTVPPFKKGQPTSGSFGDSKPAKKDIPERRWFFTIDANGVLSDAKIIYESEFQERFGDRLQPLRPRAEINPK